MSNLFNQWCALLRRDKDGGIRERHDVVLLAWTRKEIISRAELDFANAYQADQDDDFLGALMRMARKARTLRQAQDGGAAARIVVAEETAIDSGIVGRFPFAFDRFVHKHFRSSFSDDAK